MSVPRDDGFVHLADYTPPAWRILHAELDFDLEPAATLVRARLSLEPDPAQADADLALDGVDLELLEIAVDGVALPASAYAYDGVVLHVPGLRKACVLETCVRIRPENNTRLEGLYRSGALLLTQCEAQGFRRISFFADRPDVMPRWRITLRAERARFPVLLANGNPVAQRELGEGRHEARWENPHPTPAYLFAIAAGPIERVTQSLDTMFGRRVELNVWAEAGDIARCRYALGAVERSLRWDEQRFGREYDLDVFNIVAAQDFTMGAMENKGLNIFNARYILADEATATDADFLAIESVVAHEYLHNWSGNRVTLRDWFQLSLKEGLTVFRDSEFSADLHSRALKRIEAVRLLRGRQFAEDAGALAHAVRPDRYREISNFYTLTIYEKGAEIVRLLHTLLGEKVFRAGMDRYFADNDGRAATLEDFVAAHEAASGRDLSQFARWYRQGGTPELSITASFAAGEYRLVVEQSTPATPGQPVKAPLLLPLRLALYDAEGQRIHTSPRTDAQVREDGVELTAARHELVWSDLDAAPLAVFNHGFAAPVKVHFEHSASELARLARIERDPYNRWDLLQRLATGAMLGSLERGPATQALRDALAALLADDGADPAFVAECLSLPDFDTLAESVDTIDVEALVGVREDLVLSLAQGLAEGLASRYEALAATAAGGLTGPAMAARALRNACLSWLTRLDPGAALANLQFDGAGNMTDRLAALRCLVHFDAPGAESALESFRQQFRDDPLVTDKWISLVATRPHPETRDAVAALLQSPWWKPANPNRVRAVLGTYARSNPLAFHRPDGAGYVLLAGQVVELDRVNPQVAARLLGGFESWRRLAPPQRALAHAALCSMQADLHSPDARDLLLRLLEA